MNDGGVYLSFHGVMSSIETAVLIVINEFLILDNKKVEDNDIDALTGMYCARVIIASRLGACLEMATAMLHRLKSTNDKDSDEYYNVIIFVQEKMKNMLSANNEGIEKLVVRLNNSQPVKRIIH
ncbi:MAG TPA: hypothetical protein VGK47_09615 [Nitrososphaeraceae archaeon]